MRFGAAARSLRIGTFAVFCPGRPGLKRKKLQIAAGKMRFVYAGFRTKIHLRSAQIFTKSFFIIKKNHGKIAGPPVFLVHRIIVDRERKYPPGIHKTHPIGKMARIDLQKMGMIH